MFEGYKILNTVSFLARLLLYYFMNYYNVISNKTIENVTLKYDLEIVPSMIGMNIIESIINILLLIFVVIQFFDNRKMSMNQYVTEVESKFVIVNICNTFSLITFVIGTKPYLIISSLCMMFELTILILIQHQCKFYSRSKKWYEIYFGDIPFSIYLGWIMIYFVIKLSITIRFYTEIENENIMFFIFIFLLGVFNSFIIYLQKNFVTVLVYYYYVILYIIKNKEDNYSFFGGLISLFVVFFFYLIILIMKICRNRQRKNKNLENCYENLEEVI